MFNKIKLIAVTASAAISFAALPASADVDTANPISAFDSLVSATAKIKAASLPDGGGGGVAGTLINAFPVSGADYEGVLRMELPGRCTISLIGPASLVVAAHCVNDNGIISIDHGGTLVDAVCRHSPTYQLGANMGSDVALCVLQFPITGVAYERISFDLPAIGETMQLTGYGCTTPGGTHDNQLRRGPAERITPTTAKAIASNWFIDLAEVGTMYSYRAANTGVVLCPGDSGGPVFVFNGADDTGKRGIVGVNSRTTYLTGVAIFAAFGLDPNKGFIEQFVADNALSVCGVNRTARCK